MAPDGAKMVQDEAKMAQDGARMAQDVGQTSPEESRQQNKNKSIHPNSRSSSFAGSILGHSISSWVRYNWPWPCHISLRGGREALAE